jgi:hypothetical protein
MRKSGEIHHAEESFDRSSKRESNSRVLPRYGASADETMMNSRRRPFDSVTIGLHCATAVLVSATFVGACWLHSMAGAQGSDYSAVNKRSWPDMAPSL